jgi:DNA-binding beta-propeller fold protein YncE
MRLLPASVVALAVSWLASGQTYTKSTVAGGGLPVNLPGISASLSPGHVAADPAGNLFFVVRKTVLRLDATTGILTQAAGNGTTGFSGDNGPATSAQLYFPAGVAVDSAGNLYIADTNNHRIRRLTWQPVHRRQLQQAHPQSHEGRDRNGGGRRNPDRLQRSGS